MANKDISTNDKIINAYWKLAGNKKPTVSSICKLAGINRCTFYQYYLDISELANSEEEKIISELTSILNNAFPNIFTNNLDEFSNILVKIFNKNDKKIYIILNSNSLNFQNKISAELSKKLNKVFKIDSSDKNFNYIIIYLISNICSLFSYWYTHNKTLTFEEFTKLTHSLILNGLLGYVSNQKSNH